MRSLGKPGCATNAVLSDATFLVLSKMHLTYGKSSKCENRLGFVRVDCRERQKMSQGKVLGQLVEDKKDKRDLTSKSFGTATR